MGDIRNDMKKEDSTMKKFAAAVGTVLLTGVAAFAKSSMDANTLTSLNSRIEANEAKKKELSKGLGWLTKSDEIDALNKKNASLREKRNKYTK